LPQAQLSTAELAAQLDTLEQDYAALGARALSLDLTRGKPGAGQVALSDALDGILEGDYRAADGQDVRNYGGLSGLPEARALFGSLLDAPPEETLVGGNSSLTLMYQVVECALTEGLGGLDTAWGLADDVKFLCPAPGYDRHFTICEHLGIDMIPVPMLEHGPDMDRVEQLLREDPAIRGMWCVPRFSNPTGCVYSEAVVERIAALGNIAAPGFLVLWDNAYAVHNLYDDAPALASLRAACLRQATVDSLVQFGSTSKITFAGAGVGFLATSPRNLAALEHYLAAQTIGPDKVNQLRHVRFLRDAATISRHMAAHADQVRPRFERVLNTLERELGGRDMGTWTQPRGGYFISFDTQPGLRRRPRGPQHPPGADIPGAGGRGGLRRGVCPVREARHPAPPGGPRPRLTLSPPSPPPRGCGCS